MGCDGAAACGALTCKSNYFLLRMQMFRRRFCDVQGNSHGSRSMRHAVRRRAADTVRGIGCGAVECVARYAHGVRRLPYRVCSQLIIPCKPVCCKNGPFRTVKQPVSCCIMGRNALQNGPFRKHVWAGTAGKALQTGMIYINLCVKRSKKRPSVWVFVIEMLTLQSVRENTTFFH